MSHQLKANKMNSKEIATYQNDFENVPVRTDLLEVFKMYEIAFSDFERRTFSVLGRDMSADNKSIALRGKKMISDRLNELMDKRKMFTNKFNVIVKNFTAYEKSITGLIDRLQNYADECLKLEQKEIDEANKLIDKARNESIQSIKEQSIPDNEKVAAMALKELETSVEIIDDLSSRKVITVSIETKKGLVNLMNWYFNTDEFNDEQDINSISISKILTLSKGYHKDSGLQIEGISFTTILKAK